MSPGFVLQFLLCCHVSVSFAKAYDFFVCVDYVAVREFDPSCVAASTVLWNTNVQCFWCMSILVQVFVVIETFRPEVLRKSSGGCACQKYAT